MNFCLRVVIAGFGGLFLRCCGLSGFRAYKLFITTEQLKVSNRWPTRILEQKGPAIKGCVRKGTGV